MSKISVREDYTIQLEEVYNSIVFKTKEGVEYYICMRDFGLEISEKSIGTISLQPNELPQFLISSKQQI
jgi:hypothetical protein